MSTIPKGMRKMGSMEIKRLREAKGLSQTQIAKLVGLKRGSYIHIERGRRRPSVDTAKRIAEVLGVEWWQLFE